MNESLSRVDSSVPLIYHGPSDLDHPKGTHPKSCLVDSLVVSENTDNTNSSEILSKIYRCFTETNSSYLMHFHCNGLTKHSATSGAGGISLICIV